MSSGKIRILVVDDHPMVRKGLAAMIGAEDDFELAGEASDGEEAVRRAAAAAPDVVLMDLVMPRMDGITAIAALRAKLPEARFIVLTSFVEPPEVQRAMAAGASGYLSKTASSQELVTVIRAAVSGRRVLSPEATEALITASQKRPLGEDLTQREREILALMTDGLSNQQVAARLSITVATVKFHVTNILGKLHVDNRTEAVLVALKNKLVRQD